MLSNHPTKLIPSVLILFYGLQPTVALHDVSQQAAPPICKFPYPENSEANAGSSKRSKTITNNIYIGSDRQWKWNGSSVKKEDVERFLTVIKMMQPIPQTTVSWSKNTDCSEIEIIADILNKSGVCVNRNCSFAGLLESAPEAYTIDAPPPLPMAYLGTPPIPKGDTASWATTADYPSLALNNGWTGLTGFRLTVLPNGLVSNCEIIRTSGYAMLDAATCSNVTRRARFVPATNANREYIVGTYTSWISWFVPIDENGADIPPEHLAAKKSELMTSLDGLPAGASLRGRNKKPEPLNLKSWIPDQSIPPDLKPRKGMSYVAVVNNSGNVDSCTVVESSEVLNFDEFVCSEVHKNATFAPATDQNGMAASGTYRGHFRPPTLRAIN